MHVSLSSLFAAIFASNALIFLMIIIKLLNRPFPKYTTFCIMIVGLRCMIPVEFFYSITIASKKILPKLQEIGEYTIWSNLKLYQAVFFIWGFGSIFRLLYVIYLQYKTNLFIRRLPNSNKMPVLRKILESKGINRQIDLIEVPGITSPAIIGLFRTRIIIPHSLGGKNLRYILLHEIEHYIHKDLLSITLFQIMHIFYWWNPLMFFLKKEFIKLIELRADMNATKMLDKKGKAEYLQGILNIAKISNNNINPQICLGFYEKESDLVYRFKNILCEQKKKYSNLMVFVFLLLTFFSTCIVIEPYAINKNDALNTFSISDDCIIIEKNGLYDLYAGDTYLFTVDTIDGLEKITTQKETYK